MFNSGKMIRQVALIFGICIVADIICQLLPISVPASMMSLLLTIVLLMSGILKEDDIKDVSDALLSVMAMLFVPAGIGAVLKLEEVKNILFPLAITMLISLIITFLIAYFVTWTVKKQMERRKNNDKSK